MSAAALPEEPMRFEHQPVLLAELTSRIAPRAPACILDCTVGGGGHAAALLDACSGARLLGIDRDAEAVDAARGALARFGERARVLQARFSDIDELLGDCGLEQVDAILADLGVSSHQLDTASRGFSFSANGPLDMRMDPTSGPTAAEIIEHSSEAELARAIRDLGEERYATRVARAVKAAAPQTTRQLADAVRSVVRRAAGSIDPATRTFQAIRILTNRELDELGALLERLPDLLADDGIAVLISFHSLEDRLVKRAFAQAARGCICPPALPACLCGREPRLQIMTQRPVRAAAGEVAENPRARSARLRAATRIPRAGYVSPKGEAAR